MMPLYENNAAWFSCSRMNDDSVEEICGLLSVLVMKTLPVLSQFLLVLFIGVFSVASSFAASVSLSLHSGLNVVGVNIDLNRIPNSYMLLKALGGPADIIELKRLNPQTQTDDQTFYNSENLPSGANTELQPSEAWLIYAKRERLVYLPVATDQCHNVPIYPGTNLVTLSCIHAPISSRVLLSKVADQLDVTSIRHFDSVRG